MTGIEKKLKKLLQIGDTVYSANNGTPMKIKEIGDEGFSTEEDFFFFEEVRKLFFLTKKGYEWSVVDDRNKLSRF